MIGTTFQGAGIYRICMIGTIHASVVVICGAWPSGVTYELCDLYTFLRGDLQDIHESRMYR